MLRTKVINYWEASYSENFCFIPKKVAFIPKKLILFQKRYIIFRKKVIYSEITIIANIQNQYSFTQLYFPPIFLHINDKNGQAEVKAVYTDKNEMSFYNDL